MIVILGMVGAGKTAQGQLLAKNHSWLWLSCGELLRESKDPRVVQHIASGSLVPDEIVKPLIQDALKKAATNKVIIDGFPRRVSQAVWLDQMANDQIFPVEVALQLVVDEKTAKARLASRARDDDIDEAIARRMEVYRRDVVPVAEYYEQSGRLITIDASPSVEDIAASINESLRRRAIIG